jgi:hypothetical protein
MVLIRPYLDHWKTSCVHSRGIITITRGIWPRVTNCTITLLVVKWKLTQSLSNSTDVWVRTQEPPSPHKALHLCSPLPPTPDICFADYRKPIIWLRSRGQPSSVYTHHGIEHSSVYKMILVKIRWLGCSLSCISFAKKNRLKIKSSKNNLVFESFSCQKWEESEQKSTYFHIWLIW